MSLDPQHRDYLFGIRARMSLVDLALQDGPIDKTVIFRAIRPSRNFFNLTSQDALCILVKDGTLLFDSIKNGVDRYRILLGFHVPPRPHNNPWAGSGRTRAEANERWKASRKGDRAVACRWCDQKLARRHGKSKLLSHNPEDCAKKMIEIVLHS